MFVDIVGYTGLCEHETPEVVVALLRRFHGLVRAVIGLNDGTVELTAGDCAMATFDPDGTEGRPAGAALACAFALRDRVACFNAFDKPPGAPPLRIGIGIHIGPVVRAEVGAGEAPMMIGDTVNTASRLQAATREIGAEILVSDAVVAAARAEAVAAIPLPLAPVGAMALRGRTEPLSVWRDGADGPGPIALSA
jgi:adenylate cyclase